MVTIASMKCACEKCLCVVSLEDAIAKNGKYYCCEACSDLGETHLIDDRLVRIRFEPEKKV